MPKKIDDFVGYFSQSNPYCVCLQRSNLTYKTSKFFAQGAACISLSLSMCVQARADSLDTDKNLNFRLEKSR